MAYAPLLKFVPVDTDNTCGPTNVAKPSLSEVLRSDPVKRLFNQPNLIIKTVPLNLSTESNKNIFENKKNGMNAILLNSTRLPELVKLSVKTTDEEKEEEHLLPSKIRYRRSGISLVPVRKKVCGHYEPCENIVCDVIVQQYMDQDGVSPMLATDIEEEEINAPVDKHCKNERCDALSIDHNRCRRGLIKLNRCDKSRVCDICETTLKGSRHVNRIYHRNCRRKDEYRHINVDRTHLLRERMRERELQILESAKTKRNDYSDPMRAMEILRKNEELIIIPKTVPSRQAVIAITSLPAQSTGCNLPIAQSVDANSREKGYTNLGNVSIVSRGSAMPDSASRPGEPKTQPMRFPSLQHNSYVACAVTRTAPAPTASVPSASVVVSSQNRYVHLAAPSQITSTMAIASTANTTTTTTVSTVATTSTTTAAVQPIAINNWLVSSSPHLLTATSIQPKSFLAPIRVLPITKLITAPSLLHRTHGIPKFCIMTTNQDNLRKQLTIPNNSPSQRSAAATTVAAPVTIAPANPNGAQQKVVIKIPIQHSPQKRQPPKKLPKEKNFFCMYCSKNFSTDWYFKMHVARHKEKPFSCNFCEKSFSNKFDMKKHMSHQHTPEFPGNKRNYVYMSSVSLNGYVKTHATSRSKEAKRSKKLKKKQDETGCTATVRDSNGEYTKVKRTDPPNNNICTNNDEDQKVCINGGMMQDNNTGSLEDARVKGHDDRKVLIIKGDSGRKTNGFSFVSVKKDINLENLKKETEIIMSR